MKNPANVAAKWQRNIGAAGQSIIDGVNAVTVNPADLAAAQAQVASANYQAAIQSGKWQAGLARTSLAAWQNAMKTKGIQNIASGAAAGAPKVQAFMQQLLPAVASAVASLPPRGTAAQNQQRMIQFSQAMSQFKRS